MAILECIGIARAYNADNAPLLDVNIEVSSGQFIAIAGPSGSGKSTLLNILGLLDRADSGHYMVGGIAVDSMSDHDRDEFRGRSFGFVFQSSYLIPGRTTAQNMIAALQYSGTPTSQWRDALTRALSSVGMLHKANDLVDHLSGGERQRVAIARAIAHGPQVIFMDEPTGALDDDNTETVVSLIENLCNSGLTIVVVTHDERVSSRAHRQLRLGHGQLQEVSAGMIGSSPGDAVTVQQGDPPHQTSPARRRLTRFRDIVMDSIFSIMAKPLRSLIAVVIIALGASGFVSAGGFSASASAQVDETINSAAGSIVRAKFNFEKNTVTSQNATVALSSVNALDSVVSSYTQWDLNATSSASRTVQGAGVSLPVRAIQGDFAETVGATSVPESAISLMQGDPAAYRDTVIMGHAAAEMLGVHAAGPGQVIWVGTVSLSVIGILEPALGQDESLDSVLLVNYATAEHIAQHINVAEFVIRTDRGAATPVAQAIPLALSPAHPEQVSVETVAQLARLRASIGTQLQSLVQITGGVLVVLAVLVTSAIATNAVNARRGEIALRRAVGARKFEVGALFVIENAVLGLLGGILGIAIGQLTIIGGAQLLGWTPVIPLPLLFAGPLVGFAVAAAGAVLPVLRSASIEPSRELHAT